MLVRISAVLIAASIAMAVLWPGADSVSAGPMMGSKTGDLNVDGSANSLDAVLVLQYDAAMYQPPAGAGWWHAAADVNCDTVVNAVDAALILQAGAGLYHLRA